MIQLLPQLALVNQARQRHRGRPIDQREGDLGLWFVAKY